MKTLSKSPYGIYLLGKDEVASTLGLVPLSELTKEQAREFTKAIYGMPYAKSWLENRVNQLLRQNNEPELQQGERPHDDPRMSYYWEIATNPADILIETP